MSSETNEQDFDEAVSQSAEIVGRYNTVVQIVGDGNTVASGHAHLELYLPPKVENPQGIELLDPKSRAIPFIGRNAELNGLRAWLGSDKPVSVRVVIGGAGTGKTRLALHLCELAQSDGWDAGFVDSGELVRFRSQQNLATWSWQRPTLIVIDYAALHAQQIYEWLRELGQRHSGDGKPLRLLLLERFAEPGIGWWQTAFGRGGFGSLAVQRMLDPPEPIPLNPLAADDRRAVLDATLEQAGSGLRAPREGGIAAFEGQLEKVGEPLLLMMAGLRAVDTGITSALSLNKTELALDLADRELERIERTAQAHGVSSAMLVHLAACATLCRGLGRQTAIDAAREEQPALGYDDASPPASLADALIAALPGADGSIAPILPDLIGEAAILRALADPQVEGKAAVERAFARAGQQVAATLIRAAQDFAGAGYDQPVTWLDALIGKEPRDPIAALLMIADGMPWRSVALAPLSARLWTVITEMLRDLAGADPDRFLPPLAGSLAGLADSLSEVGQRREALEPAKEAVAICRQLAAKAPDAYRPDLAFALNTLATMLSGVGRRHEALGPAKETADLYRELAAETPDAYRPDLAMVLNNLAGRLMEVGHRQEALEPAKEAVAIRRQLAAKAPDAYRPALALALSNLAVHLDNIGDRGGALDAVRQAVAIRRELAAKAPDAYRPALAMSLNNLGNRLSKVGRYPEALGAAEEAVQIYRELVARAPVAFRPLLARALHNLAASMNHVGDHQGALEAAQEAVAIRRELAMKAPGAFRPDLAKSLSTLANCLRGVGRRQEALGPAQEAANLYRELVAKAPDAYRADFANALNTLAVLRSEVAQRQEALGPAQEAVDLYRALAAQAPDAYRPDLAGSLMAYANCLDTAGDRDKAIERNVEAIEVYTPVLLALPATFADNARAMCAEYLERCEMLGREPDSELLAPIVEVLEGLPEKPGDDEEEEGDSR